MLLLCPFFSPLVNLVRLLRRIVPPRPHLPPSFFINIVIISCLICLIITRFHLLRLEHHIHLLILDIRLLRPRILLLHVRRELRADAGLRTMLWG